MNRANDLRLLEMVAKEKRNVIVSIGCDFAIHLSFLARPNLQCSIYVPLNQGAATQLVYNDTVEV